MSSPLLYVYYDAASESTVITSKDFGKVTYEETPGWEYGNSYTLIRTIDISKDTLYIEDVREDNIQGGTIVK